MTFNAAALAIAADAVESAITHVQAHSAAPGAAGTTAAVGARVVPTGKVAGNGTVTLTGAFTGLAANQTTTHMSYWTALTGGTFLGSQQITTGDTQANAAGAVTLTATETGSAT